MDSFHIGPPMHNDRFDLDLYLQGHWHDFGYMSVPHAGPLSKLQFSMDSSILGQMITAWEGVSCAMTFDLDLYLQGHCPASRLLWSQQDFEWRWSVPLFNASLYWVFFSFVWFVFINHIFQFYYELCTYCNILDIYLSKIWILSLCSVLYEVIELFIF